MDVEVVTDRATLGRLRLPWCVDKSTRTKPISISDQRDRAGEALSIRVRDISDARVREALGRQIARDGFSLEKIEDIVSSAEAAGHLPSIHDSAGFWVNDELVLMEGCHRTCALYLLDPPHLEMRISISEAGWPSYFDPRLTIS
jgi:hypothetical protein